MKTNETTTKPTLTVSTETANFVGCIKEMQTLYSNVYSALTALYGDEAATNIINDSFYTEFKNLERRVSEFLVASISEKIGETGNAEI